MLGAISHTSEHAVLGLHGMLDGSIAGGTGLPARACGWLECSQSATYASPQFLLRLEVWSVVLHLLRQLQHVGGFHCQRECRQNNGDATPGFEKHHLSSHDHKAIFSPMAWRCVILYALYKQTLCHLSSLGCSMPYPESKRPKRCQKKRNL